MIRNLFRKKGDTDVSNETNDNEAEIVDLDPEAEATEGSDQNNQAQQQQQSGPSAREADLTNKLIRLQADFDNFRKRSLAGRAEARDEARKEIVLDLLPIYDNFLRAMDHAEETEDYGSLRGGVEGILQQMREFFNRQNVKEIDAQAGIEFDPNLHEAVGMVPGDADKHHTIAQEVQKGFELNGNVLRPARVLVFAGE